MGAFCAALPNCKPWQVRRSVVLLVLHVGTVVSAPALADCHHGGTWPWTCKRAFITSFITMSFARNDKISVFSLLLPPLSIIS